LDQVTSVTTPDPDGAGGVTASVTAYAYDYLNRLSSTTDALSGVTAFTYDLNGNLINLRDPVNNDTAWAYDGAGRVTMETNELNKTRSFYHDAAGNLTRKMDRNNRVTQYTFDDLDRMTSEVWISSGNPVPVLSVSTTTPGGPPSEVQRVGFTASVGLGGGTFTLSFGGNTTSALSYTASAATVQSALEGLASIGSGNVSVVKTTDTSTSKIYTVTFQGSLAAANQSQITINTASITAYVTKTDTQATDTQGGGSGANEVQVVTLSNATDGTFRLAFAGQTTAPIAYNASNSTVDTALEGLTNIGTGDISVTGSNGGPWTVTFNGGGLAGVNVASLQGDAASTQSGSVSRTISYTYDTASELTSVTDPDSTYAYTYDAIGRVLTSSNSGTSGVPTTVLTWAYNAAGLATSETVSVASTADYKNEYSYDNLLRLTQMDQIAQGGGNSVASKRIEFAYNAIGQFISIARKHKPSGSWVEIATTELAYDTLSRLTDIDQKRGGSSLFTATSYDYDRMNRVTQMTSQDGTADYAYDKHSRLTGVNFSYQTDESYSYDANGNRTGGSYSVGTNNRVTSDGTYNYTHDDEGNVTRRTKISDGSYRENTYDYRNRLTQVQDKNVTNTVLTDFDYAYDVFDHLINRSVDSDGPGGGSAVVERYVYNGDQVALAFDGANTMEHRYLSAPMIDQIMADEDALGAILTPLTDLQGSVTDLVNTSGSSQNHINYSAFGEILSQTGSATFICGFDGLMGNDEADTWQAMGNSFSPGTGGWNTPVAGPLNPYSFGASSPPNTIQPNGMMPPPVNPPVGPTMSQAEYIAWYQQWMLANMPPPPPNPGPSGGPTMSMGTNTLRAGGWRNNMDNWDPSQRALVQAEVAAGQDAAVNMVEGLAGFTPGAGVGLSAVQLMTGEHLDGKKLTTTEKVFAGIDVVLVIAGPLVGGVAKNVDNVGVAVAKNLDEVGNAPKAATMTANAVADSPAAQMAASVAKGRAGELAAGITGAKKGVISPRSGKMRFPDLISETLIKEVKNVVRQGLTSQIKDYIAIATDRHIPFELWTHKDTILSKPLAKAIAMGDIIHRTFAL
ncbi:MAG: putative toxin, partial [Pirellulaceae bacterium]